MQTIERKAKSPYQRHRKTPYRYSELYHQWKSASGANKRRLGHLHTERFLYGRQAERVAA